MRTRDTKSIAKYIAGAESIVSELGITIEVGSDFDFFCSIPKLQPGRHAISPIFDPEESDISSSNGFWLIGRNESGEIVLTQAIKLVPVGKSGFLDHFENKLADYRPKGDKLDIAKSQIHLTDRAARLSGNLCYYGELWIDRSYRGSCLTAVMPRLMFAMAIAKWSPNVVFGIMEPLAACKGLAAREGFMHLEQGGLHWWDRAASETFEEWLVWTTRDDFIFNMRVSLDMLAKLYPTRTDKKAAKVSKVA
ncbi:hypothetical protein [Anderseniella sp. Alg231-50]|uniref:hypothetical protein n=1 Tax=Anderseniella sp. Alg231-50 TaxID=1922226 RepID=UPI00307C2550